jgi:hypothetical protein
MNASFLPLSLSLLKQSLLHDNVQFENLFDNPGFYTLSTIQKLVAAYYYSVYIRNIVVIGDIKFYNMAKWIESNGGGM